MRGDQRSGIALDVLRYTLYKITWWAKRLRSRGHPWRIPASMVLPGRRRGPRITPRAVGHVRRPSPMQEHPRSRKLQALVDLELRIVGRDAGEKAPR